MRLQIEDALSWKSISWNNTNADGRQFILLIVVQLWMCVYCIGVVSAVLFSKCIYCVILRLLRNWTAGDWKRKEKHSWRSFSFLNFNLICANAFDLIIIMAQCQPRENVYEEEYYVLVVANIVIDVIFIRNFPFYF